MRFLPLPCHFAFLAMVLVSTLTACSDGSVQNPPTVVRDTGGHDPDGGDDVFDASPDAIGDFDVGPLPPGCVVLAPQSLGTLQPGADARIDSRFANVPRNVEAVTTCYSGMAPGGRAHFVFQVSEPSIVEFSVITGDAISVTLEVTSGPCEADRSEFCTTESSQRAIALPGVRYSVLLDAVLPAASTGEYVMHYTSAALACTPGAEVCDGGHREQCVQGREVRLFPCAADACNAAGTACQGDTCGEAIEVNLSAGESVSFAGHRSSYTNRWSAEGRTGCNLHPDTPPGPTEGNETFFRLPGLRTGQTLTVDATAEQGSYGFLVLPDDCGAQICLHATAGTLDFEALMTWTVPDDGDYLVVVEPLGVGTRPWQIAFSLE